MPIDYRHYHPNWKTIVQQIKDRAGDRCEFCGVPNGESGKRDTRGVWHTLDSIMTRDIKDRDDGFDKNRLVMRIVLTTAHLDHDVNNNDPANLRLLCQQCHLRWDAKHHARNAAETRRRKKIAVGQLEIA